MSLADDMMDALQLGLASALPSRLVTRNFVPLAMRPYEELIPGIVSLIRLGEGEYANYLGREAQLGTVKALLIGQLQVEEGQTALDVERAEIALAEEIKTFLQGAMPAPVADCLSDGYKQSGQLEFPRGWVVFELEMRT